MPSNSIQTAYTPILMPTQHSEDISLRRSNVDGNFYSHEFDHEEVVEAMDEVASQTSSVDKPWKRVFEAPSRRVYPVPNGSLRERAPPSTRVQELAEPLQIPNGSLRERSPPGARVQEIVEPLQPPNSLEFWQTQPLDELRQLAAELNRRLELGIAGSTAHRSGPTDERFFQRFINEGTPSVVRPVTIQDQHPDVRFQTPANTHGQAYGFCPSLSVAFTLMKAQSIA